MKNCHLYSQWGPLKLGLKELDDGDDEGGDAEDEGESVGILLKMML